MKLHTLTLLAMLLFSSLVLLGQEQCISDSRLKEALEIHPFLVKRRAKLQKEFDSAKDFVGNRGTIVIPVVVHVVYNTAEQNISDEQVRSQIAAINRDFRLKNKNIETANANFRQLATDVNIEFCLVNTDPNGNPTIGITRSMTNEEQIGLKETTSDHRKAIFYDELSGYNVWEPASYLNIWVCELGSGVYGYSSFPEGTIPAEDGIVVDYRSFGSIGTAEYPTNLGKTLSHEIGHYLNLQHIWGNTIGDCSVDDGIADTPPQERPTGGCPTSSQVSCSSFDMYNNYMNYVHDACLSIFTAGQVKQMLYTLNHFRTGLLNTTNCSLDILEDPLAEIKIKGNPTKDKLILSLDRGSLFEAKISIINSLGQIVLAEKKYYFPAEQTFFVGHLPKGIYYIQMTTSKRQMVRKFLKI